MTCCCITVESASVGADSVDSFHFLDCNFLMSKNLEINAHNRPKTQHEQQCVHDIQTVSLKTDDSIFPLSINPGQSGLRSALLCFLLRWGTSSLSSSVSSHQTLLPPLIPSQDLKPVSEAAKRSTKLLNTVEGEGGGVCSSYSASSTEQPLPWSLHQMILCLRCG